MTAAQAQQALKSRPVDCRTMAGSGASHITCPAAFPQRPSQAERGGASLSGPTMQPRQPPFVAAVCTQQTTCPVVKLWRRSAGDSGEAQTAQPRLGTVIIITPSFFEVGTCSTFRLQVYMPSMLRRRVFGSSCIEKAPSNSIASLTLHTEKRLCYEVRGSGQKLPPAV